jgi:hypothetical protein
MEAHRSGGNWPAENRTFHYLIRIAECALPLHCEIEAQNAAAARQQVQRIPNLIEWREISVEELLKYQDENRAQRSGRGRT